MSATRTVCVLDAGAVWTKGALFELGEHPSVLAVVSGGSANPNVVGVVTAESHLGGLLLRLHHLGRRDPSATSAVCIGISAPDVGRRAAGLVLPHLEAVCVPDVDLIAATVGQSRVAVVAGIGSMAVRFDGERRQYAGGHGWYLGDEGGAAAIGRDALRAVLSGGATPALMEAVTTRMGIAVAELPASLYEWVYRNQAPQHHVPDLAPVVTALADGGDPSADLIVATAVRAIVDLAAALSRPGDRLVFGGTVAAAVQGRLRAHMAERAATTLAGPQFDPGSQFDPEPQFYPDGVAGGALLAADEAGNTSLHHELVSLWQVARETLVPPWEHEVARDRGAS